MKKVLRKKNLFVCIALIAMYLCFIFINKSYSQPRILEPQLCTLSDEYKRWEKLSEEEKANTIVPAMCDSEKDTVSYNYFSYDLKGALPSSYDIRNYSYKPAIKNQQSTGGCWAFATTTALESYAKKKLNLTHTYSTRHIEYSSVRSFLNSGINEYGYNRSPGDGGNYFMSSSYLANARGPIAETSMPFENNENNIDISSIQNKTNLVDVNDMAVIYGTDGDACTTSEIQEIKELIYEYGAVASTTFMTTSSSYYDSTNAAFYYNGSSIVNHAITIVGWDDNYSKNNFSSSNRPSSNGAWLIQNSYGTSFGKSGYYYISYEDVHICDFYMAIMGVDQDFDDNSYILDKLGYNSYMGYGSTTDSYTQAYGMNVFTKTSDENELLKEITFGTNGSGSYTIYYKEGNASSGSVTAMKEIGSGTISYPGYVTHKLDSPVLLDADLDTFSIAVFYDMDTSIRPVPISSSAGSKYTYIEAEQSTSFISLYGSSWTDLYSRNSIVSIKAFTDTLGYDLSLDSASVTYNSTVDVKITTTTKNIDNDKLEVIIKNSSGTTITPKSLTLSNLNNNLKYINLSFNSTIANGTYTAYAYYENNLLAQISFKIVTSDNLTSDVYQIDKTNYYIYITPNTTINNFVSNIDGSSNSVYNGSKLVTSGKVGTGMTIDNYTVIIKGDVTSDGVVNISDVVKIADHTIKQNTLTKDYYMEAAEVTSDGVINISDVVKIADYTIDDSIVLWR